MGNGRPTTFYADVRRDGHYRPTCKGMVYAKMFYGGIVLLFGGTASPLNSSSLLLQITDIKINRHKKVGTIYPTRRSGMQQILKNSEA